MSKPPKVVVPGLNRGAGIPPGYILGRPPGTGKGPAQLLNLGELRRVGLATAAGATQSTSMAISTAHSETVSLSSSLSTVISGSTSTVNSRIDSLSTAGGGGGGGTGTSTSLSQISSSLSSEISTDLSRASSLSTVISGSTSTVNSRIDSLSTAGGGGGGTNAGLSAHRYWIIHFIGSHNFAAALSEIEMHATPGGADQCSGGTPFASDVSAGAAANAFDGNINTFWAASTGAGGGPYYQPCWIGYDFGAGVTKVVQEIAVTARNDAASNQAPAFGRLMFSDDAVFYRTAYEWNFATDFAAGEKRTAKSPYV